MKKKINIEKFESWIKDQVKTGSIKYPLQDEHLKKLFFGEEIQEIKPAFLTRVEKSVKRAMEEWALMDKKMTNPRKSNSIGEYLKLFRLKYDISISDASKKVKIEPAMLEQIESDSTNPINIPIEGIAGLIQFLMLSLNDAIQLLEKSVVLYENWDKGHLANSYSRIDSTTIEADRDNVLDNAMRELFVKVKMNKKNSMIQQIPIAFKEDLKEELQKRGYNV